MGFIFIKINMSFMHSVCMYQRQFKKLCQYIQTKNITFSMYTVHISHSSYTDMRQHIWLSNRFLNLLVSVALTISVGRQFQVLIIR